MKIIPNLKYTYANKLLSRRTSSLTLVLKKPMNTSLTHNLMMAHNSTSWPRQPSCCWEVQVCDRKAPSVAATLGCLRNYRAMLRLPGKGFGGARFSRECRQHEQIAAISFLSSLITMRMGERQAPLRNNIKFWGKNGSLRVSDLNVKSEQPTPPGHEKATCWIRWLGTQGSTQKDCLNPHMWKILVLRDPQLTISMSWTLQGSINSCSKRIFDLSRAHNEN